MLVRDELAGELRELLAEMSVSSTMDDLRVQGKDGTGLRKGNSMDARLFTLALSLPDRRVYRRLPLFCTWRPYVPSRPPAGTARPSSPGITTNIATAGWACTLPLTSTTAQPRPSVTCAPPCSPTHSRRNLNGSSASHQSRHTCLPARGSTRPTSHRRPLSEYRSTVRQSG
jgi:hypothetical protein